MGLGFTGYSLVYDQLSYWATTVGTNLMAAVPVFGTPILWMLRGGPDVTANTLARFYNFHIGVLPTLFVAMLVLHIVLVRLHGVAPLRRDPRRETYGSSRSRAARSGGRARACCSPSSLTCPVAARTRRARRSRT